MLTSIVVTGWWVTNGRAVTPWCQAVIGHWAIIICVHSSWAKNFSIQACHWIVRRAIIWVWPAIIWHCAPHWIFTSWMQHFSFLACNWTCCIAILWGLWHTVTSCIMTSIIRWVGTPSITIGPIAVGIAHIWAWVSIIVLWIHVEHVHTMSRPWAASVVVDGTWAHHLALHTFRILVLWTNSVKSGIGGSQWQNEGQDEHLHPC